LLNIKKIATQLFLLVEYLMKLQTLEQSILFTISYFDVFEYPLTHWEVWRYLFCYKAELDEVIEKLDELIRLGRIEMKNGFYFLPGKSNLVEKRAEKYEISEKFWRKAIFAIKILSYLPFIKTISVVNLSSFFNCEKGSDIDLFIITEKNKIWTARFLSTFLMHILGLRRYKRKIAKRICLSYYISEEKMNLEYTNPEKYKIFLAFWIAQHAPVLNYNKTFEKFYKENRWIADYLPNSSYIATDYYINFIFPLFANQIRSFLYYILKPHFIEKILKLIQYYKIQRTHKKIGSPSSVMYTDYILKFHTFEWKRLKEKHVKLKTI